MDSLRSANQAPFFFSQIQLELIIRILLYGTADLLHYIAQRQGGERLVKAHHLALDSFHQQFRCYPWGSRVYSGNLIRVHSSFHDARLDSKGVANPHLLHQLGGLLIVFSKRIGQGIDRIGLQRFELF
ncbi:hypothetical protein D3C75_1022510 [compost metagenome]